MVGHAIFHSKSGFSAIGARAFVDATGDADLTILAGGQADFGDEAGNCQPMTLCFKLARVDWSKFSREEVNALYRRAVADGRIHCQRENVLTFHHLDDDVMHFNTTRILRRSAVDGKQLSEAELEGHQQFREFFRWLKAEVPGMEQAEIRSIAQHIGVRESRRIRGIRRIGREAFDRRARFEDAIARCNYQIDIHSPNGSGTERCQMGKNEFYEIPFGCIVPAGLKNVAVGGRPISVDHALHSSCRVMGPAISLGQAAGGAAAMSAATGTAICDLDGKAVRAELKKLGAFL